MVQLPVYLIDTENVQNSWADILYCTKPGDTVYIFYTDKSPKLHMDHMDFLTDCRARVEYVECYRTEEGGNNALDFQLVSMLGYLIANSVNQQRREVYFISSCDGGFDEVVRFWRRNNILIQRIVPDLNDSQKLKAGPMVTAEQPGWPAPVAIKPHFSRIVKYAKAFAKYLYKTIYYDFRFEIAEVYADLHDRNLAGDKFSLAFRTAMARSYGVKNGLYQTLKPAFEAIAADEKTGFGRKPASGATPADTANAGKPGHPDGGHGEAPVRPIVPSFSGRPVPDAKKLNALFHASTQIQALESSIKKQLSAPLKSCAHDVIMAMMCSFDSDIEIWRENYKAELKSRCFDIKSLPGIASTIIPSSWSKSDRAKLTGILASAK